MENAEQIAKGLVMAGAIANTKTGEILAQGAVDISKQGFDAAIRTYERVCGPAQEEWGLLRKEKELHKRHLHAIDCAREVERKLLENNVPDDHFAHPKSAKDLFERASWEDDSFLRDMCAGLIAAACTEEGKKEDNVIYEELLGKMTGLQARLFIHICQKVDLGFFGWRVFAYGCFVKFSSIVELFGVDDFSRITAELELLKQNGILDSERFGIDTLISDQVFVAPTELALRLFIRCQGSRKSAREYFTRAEETCADYYREEMGFDSVDAKRLQNATFVFVPPGKPIQKIAPRPPRKPYTPLR